MQRVAGFKRLDIGYELAPRHLAAFVCLRLFRNGESVFECFGREFPHGWSGGERGCGFRKRQPVCLLRRAASCERRQRRGGIRRRRVADHWLWRDTRNRGCILRGGHFLRHGQDKRREHPGSKWHFQPSQQFGCGVVLRDCHEHDGEREYFSQRLERLRYSVHLCRRGRQNLSVVAGWIL